jgi:hypothetical protein
MLVLNIESFLSLYQNKQKIYFVGIAYLRGGGWAQMGDWGAD